MKIDKIQRVDVEGIDGLDELRKLLNKDYDILSEHVQDAEKGRLPSFHYILVKYK